MASPASTRKQIVDSIKEATNILITVSSSPSVDELSAALGLTIFLNDLDKHATAVFSGDIPPVITFLEPDKTFEQNADSLRDFIIALDKEKADHLRYKVVDDSVKIFITPYRTTIDEDDLEFSQGDYNVDLVLGLNVQNNDHLDEALSAHGRILHDATVATITAGGVQSSLGSIDWHDDSASGVSEMLVELIDGLKTPKVVMTEQIATALLTGIVSVTDRFGNEATSSKAMSAAAELIAAGANPQLIAVKLEGATDDLEKPASPIKTDNSLELSEGESTKINSKNPEKDNGALTIRHKGRRDLDEVARQTREDDQARAAKEAKEVLDDFEPIEPEPEPGPDPEPESEPLPTISPISNVKGAKLEEPDSPSIGGTLNATTEQAADDKRRELADERNRTILTHGGYVGDQQRLITDIPLNASMAPVEQPDNFNPLMDGAGLPGLAPAVSAQTPNLAEPISPLGEMPSELVPDNGLAQALSMATPAESANDPTQALISALTNDTNAMSSPATSTMSNNTVYSASPGMNLTPFAEPPQLQSSSGFIATPLASTQLASPEETVIQPDQGAELLKSLPPIPGLEMPNFDALPPLPTTPGNFDLSQLPSLPSPDSPPQQSPAPTGDFNPSAFQIPGQ